MKIYTDDSLIKYVDTTVSIIKTKTAIDLKLMEYDASDIAWHWKPEENDIYVQFALAEEINGLPVRVIIRVNCPLLYDRANKLAKHPERREDRVNLQVGMRSMYWYIKTHLETAYGMQSSRVAGFLPDIVTTSGKTYFDTILHRLPEIAALPESVQGDPKRDVNVIKPGPRNVTYE